MTTHYCTLPDAQQCAFQSYLSGPGTVCSPGRHSCCWCSVDGGCPSSAATVAERLARRLRADSRICQHCYHWDLTSMNALAPRAFGRCSVMSHRDCVLFKGSGPEPNQASTFAEFGCRWWRTARDRMVSPISTNKETVPDV